MSLGKGVKVDPKLKSAIANVAGGQSVRVLLKLNTKNLGFGKLPPSNSPNNPRLVEFNREVEDVVQKAAGRGRGNARIVSRAANIGVATLEAPRTVVQQLMDEDRLLGMKFVSWV